MGNSRLRPLLTTHTEKLRNVLPGRGKCYYFLKKNSGLGSVLIRFDIFFVFVRDIGGLQATMWSTPELNVNR